MVDPDRLPPVVWKGVHNGYGVIDDEALQQAVYRRDLAAVTAQLVNKASTTVVNPLGPLPDKPPRSKVELPDDSLTHRDVEGGLLWQVKGSMLLAHDEASDSKVAVARFLYRSASGQRYFVVQRNHIRPLQDRAPRPPGRPRGLSPMAAGAKLHPDHDRSHTAEVEAARLYESMSVRLVSFEESFPGLKMEMA